MENLAIMKELERGREYVNQLRRLIFIKSDNSTEVDGEALMTSYAEDLAAKVEDSLTNAILLLNNNQQHPDESQHKHYCENRSATTKDRRRFSPQKRKSTHTWEEYSKIGTKEDGYAWRKYGEKFILNAKHPRCYLRCSYKYDRGCEATKQVQIIQDDPPLYKTTYFSFHTCSKPHMFLHSHNDLSNSTTTSFIRFNNNPKNNSATFDQNKDNTTFFLPSSSFPRPVRNNMEEFSKNIKQENINDYVPNSSSSNNDSLLLSPAADEVLPFESDDLMDVISSFKIWRTAGRTASN